MSEEIHIEIPGFVIAAKAWGDKNAQPILCLHGMLDNAASFDFLAPLIPDAYLVAIDFPGTGLSSHYPQDIFMARCETIKNLWHHVHMDEPKPVAEIVSRFL